MIGGGGSGMEDSKGAGKEIVSEIKKTIVEIKGNTNES